MKFRWLLACFHGCLGLSLVMTPLTMKASTIIQESPAQRTRAADVICAVKVIRSEVLEDRAIPVTQYTVEPLLPTCVKGAPQKQFLVLNPGGKSKNKPLVSVAGGARLEINQTYLLFLEKNPDGKHYVLRGLSAGAELLTRDSKTGHYSVNHGDKTISLDDYSKQLHEWLKTKNENDPKPIHKAD